MRVTQTLALTCACVCALSFTGCSRSGDDGGDGGRLTGTDRFRFALIYGDTAYMVSAGTAIDGTVIIPAYYRPDAASRYRPVKEIDSRAFQGRSAVTRVYIPATVTEIRQYAFRECTGLARVYIPDTVTVIGGSAFERCTGIAGVTIPASVTRVGAGAFALWTSGQTIAVEGRADREEAVAAGWDEGWDSGCDAAIIYRGQ